MVRTFTDVTDYVQAQNALKRSSLLLQATQSMAAVGGWEIDALSGAMFWTDEVYRMLEVSPENFSPNQVNVWQFFPPESMLAIRASMVDSLTHGKGHDMEIPMLTAKGRRLWVHCKNSPSLEGGRVIRSTSVLRDITAQREAQQEAERRQRDADQQREAERAQREAQQESERQQREAEQEQREAERAEREAQKEAEQEQREQEREARSRDRDEGSDQQQE